MPLYSGLLTIITGPSGVGKGTIVKHLLERHPQIWLSISATTRKPRKGEFDGINYFFKSIDAFKELIQKDGFLEWAEFAGNYYGTPKDPVISKLSVGQPVLLEIELEGARQVRKSFPEGRQIFIAPPSFEELERRIRGRGTDKEDAIRRRLSRASEELVAKKEFDEIVINGELGLALTNLEEKMNLAKN